MNGRALSAAAVAAVALCCAPAGAEWQPRDLRPSKAALAPILDGWAKNGTAPGGGASERRERWTYVNGGRRIDVRVAVRGADFKAALVLDGAPFSAGRLDGTRWRADGNGIAHDTLSDSQGDAVDRLPQSVFPIEFGDLTLAGESDRFGPAWVLLDRPAADKPHWLYVDRASGAIEHEVTREGSRVVLTAFDRFERSGGGRRPRHWHVSDGEPADELDVTVDTTEAQPVAPGDLERPPVRRTFAPAAAPPSGVVTLPAHFRGRTIWVDVDLDGRRAQFILDSGTPAIAVDRTLAERRGWKPALEHATIPALAAGALRSTSVSALAIPLGPSLSGILGFDFFFGHVVHVDYEHERVEVLTPAAAAPAFADARAFVAPMNVDEGMPLVHAAFGAAGGDRFALDTGSPHLYVFAPFARRNASLIASGWSAATFRGGQATQWPTYIEGSVAVVARRPPWFALGPLKFTDLVVGVETANDHSDAIDVPIDGIVGTDEMHLFDWWFDYDRGRVAMRRNGVR